MRKRQIPKPLRMMSLLAFPVVAALLTSLVSTAQTQQSGNRTAQPDVQFSAKRGKDETKIKMSFYGTGVYKITASDGSGTRDFHPVKVGEQLAQPCEAKQRTCKTFKVAGESYKVCYCNTGTALQLLLPAIQKVREAGGGGGGGGGSDTGGGGALCTAQKPCCYEDEKLQMSICHPSL